MDILYCKWTEGMLPSALHESDISLNSFVGAQIKHGEMSVSKLPHKNMPHRELLAKYSMPT